MIKFKTAKKTKKPGFDFKPTQETVAVAKKPMGFPKKTMKPFGKK